MNKKFKQNFSYILILKRKYDKVIARSSYFSRVNFNIFVNKVIAGDTLYSNIDGILYKINFLFTHVISYSQLSIVQ